MYVAKIQNASGEMLTLTQNESRFQVISITGLNPAPAQVNTTAIAGMDGAKFNSAKLNIRNIVIILHLCGDVEGNRQTLYRYFRTRESCTFYFQNANRDVSISGYVETVECNLFENGETMQISIVCPFPYFAAVKETIADISKSAAAFYFPFAINIGSPVPVSTYVSNRVANVFNGTDAETGATMEIDIDTENVQSVTVTNVASGDFLTVNYTFKPGDRVAVSTYKGKKSITLYRNDEATNIFGALQKGSTFFQLGIGDNLYSFKAVNQSGADVSDDVYITFHYHNLYRGV